MFGYGWDPKKGLMKLRFKMNMSKKRRGVRCGPDLSVETLETLRTVKMTKRNLLGATNCFGDYLGIAEPFTVRFRLGMKALFQQENPLAWDDDIPEEMRDLWVDLISEAVKAGSVDFAKSTRHKNSVGGPVVVGFADGAFPAYGAAVYLDLGVFL